MTDFWKNPIILAIIALVIIAIIVLVYSLSSVESKNETFAAYGPGGTRIKPFDKQEMNFNR